MALVKIQGAKEKELGIYYEVDSEVEPLGEGGMGKVYPGVCVDEKTGQKKRDVAIKFLYDDLDEQTLTHARREASIQLHNDNLIEMFGFSETETTNVLGETVKHYHIASELLEGITLADVLDGKIQDSKGELIPFAVELHKQFKEHPYDFAVKIVRNVLSGLMALHDAGYIHRDIDPGNIMLTKDEKIKIIDFGISKKISDLGKKDKSVTVSGMFIGKPEYAAPELVLGDIKHQDQTSDIYAVGILLYQCIVGHVPFQGPHHEVLQMQLKKQVPVDDIRNKELCDIILKATNKKQNLRYRSVSEFRVSIDALPSPIPDNKNTPWLVWGVTAVLGVVAGVVAAFIA